MLTDVALGSAPKTIPGPSTVVAGGSAGFRTRNVRNEPYGHAMTDNDYWREPPLAAELNGHRAG
ncbi:hypothetical protein GCM10010399_59030 [Dactylosporangium fulvum]